MICMKCDSTNIRVGVSMLVYIDSEDAHKITKKTLQKRSTDLISANWDKAQVVCMNCNYVHIGC